jgi:bifunctional non-homologous end joining protein LigD
VYVDYLQNLPGKTVAAAYAVRARPGATVSTPLGWDEVAAVIDGADPGSLRFRTEQVLERVEEYGDLFDVADRTRVKLPAA